jgi:hypothetical protein
MKIHLVSYATPRFRLRQILLGISARINHVADTNTAWNPESLQRAGFESRMADIFLHERGSGFWAWKPFVIDAKLREIPDGDIVLYCDVGRLYPFKLLDQPIAPYLRWMEEKGQDVMPGVYIPWDGAISVWTKRAALVATGMDRPDIHAASPIQASFSIWRAGAKSRDFVDQWLDLCAQRLLISDDPCRDGLAELPSFRGHRHDQALLSLCCLKHRMLGLDIGCKKPTIDVRHPSEVSRLVFGADTKNLSLSGRTLRSTIGLVGRGERALRQKVKFGKPIPE